MNKHSLADPHALVQHVSKLLRGAHLFRANGMFVTIASVHSGLEKTWQVHSGRWKQGLGFHFHGGVIGPRAVNGACYPCIAITVEMTESCICSFGHKATLAAQLPRLQREH